jgi:catechol 2,3-dioxygenase-like lactoylglutathione lyase family enzyme
MDLKKFHRSGAHLPVRNLKQTLDFYRDTLGFYEEWIWKDKDGGIRRDDMRLLFGEDPDYTATINNDKNRLNLLWFVESIDEIFAEFKEKKIEILSELTEYPYGMKEFAFVDINGYYIRVAESIDEK